MRTKSDRIRQAVSFELLGLAAVGLLGAGVFLGIQIAKPPPPPDFGVADAPPPGPASAPGEPVPAPPPPLERERQPPPERAQSPRIALIIDDLGRSLEDLDTLAALGVPLSYAVLPYESHTPEVVAELHRRRVEVLCHLPMEAKGGANPGPGALHLVMSRDELRAATHRALAAVPGVVGVNNHMDSAISADREAITTVLSVLAEEGLFYVDSRTGIDTLGYAVARQLGVPAAERQVFLDTEIDPERIREQFVHLLEVAQKRGSAIAIGHPHPETLAVLAEEISAARLQGFEFVTASQLLEDAPSG